jgi:hypothetical protein
MTVLLVALEEKNVKIIRTFPPAMRVSSDSKWNNPASTSRVPA